MNKGQIGKALIASTILMLLSPIAQSQELPKPTEGDYVAHDFQFRSGEMMRKLRLHYSTLGHAVRDSKGRVTNAVMIVHPTSADGKWYLQKKTFAGELFGPGQLLDATRYYIIAPTRLATANRASPVMASMLGSLTTTTMTWCRRSTCS